MIDTKAPHHRAPSLSGGHYRPAHRVPGVHEAERSGRVSANTQNRRARRSDGRKVHTDPAALLHRDRGFTQMLEDAGQIVRNSAHHETIEKSHIPAGPGTSKNAACRYKLEIGERVAKPGCPDLSLRRLFGFGDGARNTIKRPRKIAVFTRCGPEPVFLVPDFFGKRCIEGHQFHPLGSECNRLWKLSDSARRFGGCAPHSSGKKMSSPCLISISCLVIEMIRVRNLAL